MLLHRILCFMMLLFIGLFHSIVAASPQDAALLQLTNAERTRVGLSALCLDSRLGLAAQRHAEDMARNNYFSHTGLNGSNSSQRVKATGYMHSWVGENISAGRVDAASTLQGWMNSRGHRENILRAEYTQIGFGYAYQPSSTYKHYWVQVFGTPQDGGGCGTSSVIKPEYNAIPQNRLSWLRTRDSALTQAKRNNKLILMIAGRDECGNTSSIRNKIISDPEVSSIAQHKFVLWYSNVDSDSEWRKYTRNYLRQFTLPVIAVINPFDPENYLDRSFGREKAAVLAGWLQSFRPLSATGDLRSNWREIHPAPSYGRTAR